ncbi:hypothetical protein F7P73_08130 [Acinetobacter bohemicus]|uniref:HIRAN domain-containing protein n=1 Tax=Acinetobacter bohemicus TaxID=1435036 RepID=A0A1I6UD20_9GAMM|nr:hypothetical protein F7P73_08130 [Acinetobacter bohemicus]SFS99301.1 hypothetical protein SAMN05444586_101592 [Acinetobacter bohemicus]
MWLILIIIVAIAVITLIARTSESNKKTINFNNAQVYNYEIVGEQSYQNNLYRIAGKKEEDSKFVEVMAMAISEPSNPFDKNAVKIEINGLLVGYINKNDARLVAGKKIKKAIPAVVVGGWLDDDSEGSYGVKLAIGSIKEFL